MELIHLLNEIASFIPEPYQIVGTCIGIIVFGISLIVCFLGYRFVKIWSKVYFFGFGFLIGAFSRSILYG